MEVSHQVKVVSEPRRGGRDHQNVAFPQGEKQRIEERRHRCALAGGGGVLGE